MSSETRDEARGEASSESPAAGPEVPELDRQAGRGAGRFSAEQREALLSEFESSGETMAAFSRRRGLQAWKLGRWRAERDRKLGKPASSSRGPRAFSYDERKAAVEAFATSGMTQKAFAKIYGVTDNTLSKWLWRYREGGAKGLENRPSPRTGRGKKKRLAAPVREEVISVQ